MVVWRSLSPAPVALAGGGWLAAIEDQFADTPTSARDKAVRMQQPLSFSRWQGLSVRLSESFRLSQAPIPARPPGPPQGLRPLFAILQPAAGHECSSVFLLSPES